jgi:hypothetical protein
MGARPEQQGSAGDSLTAPEHNPDDLARSWV